MMTSGICVPLSLLQDGVDVLLHNRAAFAPEDSVSAAADRGKELLLLGATLLLHQPAALDHDMVELELLHCALDDPLLHRVLRHQPEHLHDNTRRLRILQ